LVQGCDIADPQPIRPSGKSDAQSATPADDLWEQSFQWEFPTNLWDSHQADAPLTAQAVFKSIQPQSSLKTPATSVKMADVLIVHSPLVFESHPNPGIVPIQLQALQPFGALFGKSSSEYLLEAESHGLLPRARGTAGAPRTHVFNVRKLSPPLMPISTFP